MWGKRDKEGKGHTSRDLDDNGDCNVQAKGQSRVVCWGWEAGVCCDGGRDFIAAQMLSWQGSRAMAGGRQLVDD